MNRINALIPVAKSGLKPCPFCGGPAEVLCNEQVDPKCYVVQCADDDDDGKSACTVYSCAGPYETANEAVEHWNRRGGKAS